MKRCDNKLIREKSKRVACKKRNRRRQTLRVRACFWHRKPMVRTISSHLRLTKFMGRLNWRFSKLSKGIKKFLICHIHWFEHIRVTSFYVHLSWPQQRQVECNHVERNNNIFKLAPIESLSFVWLQRSQKWCASVTHERDYCPKLPAL